MSFTLIPNFSSFFFSLLQTKAGPILVAVNPFKEVFLYGNDSVSAYRQKLKDSPHVYAVADTALNEMMRGEQNIYLEKLLFSDITELFLTSF